MSAGLPWELLLVLLVALLVLGPQQLNELLIRMTNYYRHWHKIKHSLLQALTKSSADSDNQSAS